eukprot:m.190437 g.190437  ORF g.190437 m.190437 type:complete len:152 (-) comp53630_c1_seq4:62-517(-)
MEHRSVTLHPSICSCCAPLGVYFAWAGFLEPNLSSFLSNDSAQRESSWIGFAGAIAGTGGAVFCARCVDYLKGKMKLALLVLSAATALFFAWFALVCQGFVDSRELFIFISSVGGSLFINSTIPLFYELGCETTHPVAEGITSGMNSSLSS